MLGTLFREISAMPKPRNKQPKPIITKESRIRDECPCPQCDHKSRKHRIGHRKLQGLGDTLERRPLFIKLSYSVHYCKKCDIYFNIDMSDLAAPGSPYTCIVVTCALCFVIKDKLSFREASSKLSKNHCVSVSFATIQRWVNTEKREKKYFFDDTLPSNK